MMANVNTVDEMISPPKFAANKTDIYFCTKIMQNKESKK